MCELLCWGREEKTNQICIGSNCDLSFIWTGSPLGKQKIRNSNKRKRECLRQHWPQAEFWGWQSVTPGSSSAPFPTSPKKKLPWARWRKEEFDFASLLASPSPSWQISCHLSHSVLTSCVPLVFCDVSKRLSGRANWYFNQLLINW